MLATEGQRDDLPLLPKIGRDTYFSENIKKSEDEIIEEFKKLYYPHLDYRLQDNKWDLLALAQHHGLPTRLLDWTENPLAALWFTFTEERMGDSNNEAVTATRDSKLYRTVWSFIIKNEELITINNESPDPYRQDRTTVFRPNHITKRITAQNGWFTVHKFLPEKERKFIPLNKNREYRGRLTKFKIPENHRNDILKRLDKLGINSYSLFPDLEGLSKYLAWKHFKRT